MHLQLMQHQQNMQMMQHPHQMLRSNSFGEPGLMRSRYLQSDPRIMPAIEISAANETQEIGAWDAHTIRSASLEAASDVPGASAAHELDLIHVQAEAAVPAMPVQAGGGTTTKADVQAQDLDVAEMHNMVRTRDQLRRQAKADARRQKRPLVDRSAEELATRAQTRGGTSARSCYGR